MTPFGIRRRLREFGQRLATLAGATRAQARPPAPPPAPRALAAVREAIDELRAGDFPERLASAARLGELGDPSAVDPLTLALRDEAAEVAAAAAASLGQLRARRAAAPLGEAAANGDGYFDPLTRRAALDALVALTGADALPQLILLVRDLDADLSRTAIERLGELGDPRAEATLWAVLRDDSGYFHSCCRVAAVDALASLAQATGRQAATLVAPGTRRGLAHLAAEDRDLDVRAHAQAVLAG